MAFIALGAWAQKYSARVVDAKTGEPLPYVSIYLKDGHGTLTNEDGEFHIKASQNDVLRFSFIGYEKQEVSASSLPAVIRMKPLERVLKEVVVTPPDVDSILGKVIRHLKQDYKAQKNTRHGYFVRHRLNNPNDSYMIEGFLTARSAVNLRDEAFLSATSGLNTEGEESAIKLINTNIHKVTEVGPQTHQSDFWAATFKPLASIKTKRKYYQADLETLTDEQGEELYRITFRWTHEITESLLKKRFITGTLYVDAKTLRPLSFKGIVNNAFQRVNYFRRKTHIRFYMNYDYTDGYAAVSHLSVQGGNDLMDYHILLFNVPDSDLPRDNQALMKENTLDAIDKAGADSTLWTRYDIVKRTRQEEEMAKARAMNFH